ncbi:MAG: hypothetical protein IPO88_21900 [Nannocystis sp.]|uniref:hypothetical protein n=1 Tax=Nannocystis sp. TaxID=1962667 RepID=UPI0024250B7D|nr:hypothetical protein [Nannocystis sp.]MBK9756098.1 hypothetical protein [Nannocystis sp.]
MGAWKQQAYVKASNTGAEDYFGYGVELSGDGSVLAVGAYREGSTAVGIDGDQADNSAPGAGAVYLFERDAMQVWTQRAYIKASNTSKDDWFGKSLALSADGNTLAVAAPQESSAATGIDGDQADDSAQWSGAVYVFTRDAMKVWTQQAYIKASTTDALDFLGDAGLSLSADGSVLAVAADGEASNAVGLGGDQTDNSAQFAGAVYVYRRDPMSVWTQQAYVKASNTGGGRRFGFSPALSADGGTLAVGSFGENSKATGIGGDQTDASAPLSGAVYLY